MSDQERKGRKPIIPRKFAEEQYRQVLKEEIEATIRELLGMTEDQPLPADVQQRLSDSEYMNRAVERAKRKMADFNTQHPHIEGEKGSPKT